MLQYYLVIIRFSKRFMVFLTSGENVNMSVSIHYYTGDIVPQDNVVFVFGSNPEGRHGLGAAKVARE